MPFVMGSRVGTMGGRRIRTMDDFMEKFILSMTVNEWEAVCRLRPLSRVEQLICAVVKMREHRYPGLLPIDHPLRGRQCPSL